MPAIRELSEAEREEEVRRMLDAFDDFARSAASQGFKLDASIDAPGKLTLTVDGIPENEAKKIIGKSLSANRSRYVFQNPPWERSRFPLFDNDRE